MRLVVRLVRASAAIALLAIPAAACSTKAKLVGQGGECQLATDCEEGLVCVPQQSGARICDSDLSGVQKTEDAAPPRVRDASADAASDAQADDGGATDGNSPQDATSPVDSAPPNDASPE